MIKRIKFLIKQESNRKLIKTLYNYDYNYIYKDILKNIKNKSLADSIKYIIVYIKKKRSLSLEKQTLVPRSVRLELNSILIGIED